MPEKVIRVGIIGCGWISELVHMPNLKARADVAVTAFADLSEERRALASRWFPGANCFDTAEQLFRDPTVEALVVAVPPAHNRHLAIGAFAAGKHLYLEKPLAANVEDATAIVSAWESAGCIAMLGYNFRFNPGIENAISTIRSDALGKVLTVQSRFTWMVEAGQSWRGDPALGGGVLLDLASHHIDLFHAIASGGMRCVSARERSVLRASDTIDMTMEDEQGTVFQLHASLTGGANTNHCSFLCERGQLEVDLRNPRPRPALCGDQHTGRLERLRSGLAELHPARIMAAPGFEPSYGKALGVFLDACRSGVQPKPGLQQGLDVLRVVEAARLCVQASHRSAATSQRSSTDAPMSLNQGRA